MKIIRLKLYNFARVLSGLGKTTVEIDLLNVEEHINMFVGENGSGKTSIMQCLHPFAFNSAIGDSTMNSDLIIEGKDGKKEIDILSDGNVYHIEHHYMRKKDGTISVKSFISLNNEELNESGTVVGFKAVVQDRLGVNETFLTLLSVGNSIQGFVELTAADRKTFASKIFTELGVYNIYYKSMTTLSRSMTTLLNNVTSKLSKYGAIDKNELDEKIADIDKSIRMLDEEHTQVLKDIGGVQGKLDINRSTIQEYDELQRSVNHEMDKIKAFENNIVVEGSLSELESMRDKSLEDMSDAKQRESIANMELEGKLNTKNELMNDLNNAKQSLDGIDTGHTSDNMKKHIEDIEQEIASIRLGLSSYMKIDIPKDDLVKANIYLEELTQIIGNITFLVPDTQLDSIIHDYVANSADFYNKVSRRREYLKDSIQSSELLKTLSQFGGKMEIPKFNTECNKKSCPYMEFFDQYMLLVNHEIEEFNRKHKKEQSEFEEVEELYKCISVLHEGTKFIRDHKDILSKLPKEVFNPDIYLFKYLENRTIYNVSILTEMIESVENYKKIAELEQELELSKYKQKVYESNMNFYKEVMSRIESIQDKMVNLEADILSIRQRISGSQADIRVIQNKLDRIDKAIECKKSIEDCHRNIDLYSNEMRKMEKSIAEIDRLKAILTEYRNKERDISTNLSKLRNSKQTYEVTKFNIESLEKEEIEIREKYDDVLEIRKAVSPVTGIPLDFIDYYVKSEMVDKMNHLLDSVYHGKLRLRGDLVTINDKEFTIPYQKNNTIVKDISKASDGERAVMTFAFSLVLIQSSMDKYNIMLLDEIDTSLDHYGRSKFINLLETYMDTIGAEQIFMISHNNMFDSYPVNVIMTSEMNLSNMSKASITKLYE